MARSSAPDVQTAAWLDFPRHGATLKIRHDIDVPKPKEGEVLVKLEVSGICHSDVHSIYGDTPMETDIAGHEGVGTVIELGPGVAESMRYSRVGVKWQYSTCGKCEICAVDSTACPRQNNAGRNVRGTFAQYIAAPAKDVTMVPGGLKSELVAPLLCAGLTMYSAIAKANLKPGDWLVLPGAGGGLGHLGVQIASKKDYKVIAIDTGDSKRNLCIKLGAAKFLDFREDDVEAEIGKLTSGYGVHAVVVSAGSEGAYQQGFKLLRNLGTLVCVGLPRMDFGLPITPFAMVVRGLRAVGSSCGTPQEMTELLEMAKLGHVVAQVSEFDLSDINEIIGKLARFEIEGRVVVRIPQ
jgi:alcohol dehydrogenase, propanol-preferring